MFMVVPAQQLHWSLSVMFVKHFGLQTPNRAVQLKMIWDCADQGFSIQHTEWWSCRTLGGIRVYSSQAILADLLMSRKSCQKKSWIMCKRYTKPRDIRQKKLMKRFGIWLFWTGPSIHAAGAMHLLTSAIPSIIEVENEKSWRDPFSTSMI